MLVLFYVVFCGCVLYIIFIINIIIIVVVVVVVVVVLLLCAVPWCLMLSSVLFLCKVMSCSGL